MRVVKGSSAPKLAGSNERRCPKENSWNPCLPYLELKLRDQVFRRKFGTEKQKGNLPMFFEFKPQEPEVALKTALILGAVQGGSWMIGGDHRNP